MSNITDKRLRNLQLRANDADVTLMVLRDKQPPWSLTGFVINIHLTTAEEVERLLSLIAEKEPA